MIEQARHVRPTGPTIRFFISSTFADFQRERDVLQRRVFPELRQICTNAGYRLQPIDLRWGVSEEASTDRQTLRICFDELDRCRKISSDFFLLILLGERYGSCILPPTIAADVVARLLPHFSQDERQRFDAAFRLDDNAVPAEYALLRRDERERAEDESVRLMLARAATAAGLSTAERLPFEGSATHREIALGLLGDAPDAARDTGVLCARRSFTHTSAGEMSPPYAETDPLSAQRQRGLADAVTARLPADHVLRYDVAWEGGAPRFDDEALARAYLGLLQPRIEAVIAARDATFDEMDEAEEANTAFAAQRTAFVAGRDAELAQIAAYLANADAGLPLVVTGAMGSGKSTLLAEAAKRAAITHPQAAVLARYIGVTPNTGTLYEMLADLRRAIARAYGQPEPGTAADLEQLTRQTASLLGTLQVPPERPLLCVIDAIDQFSERPQPVDWLPRALPPGVRVVVSLVPDRIELQHLRQWLPADHILTIGALSRQAGADVLRHLLGQERRTLTSDQESTVLDGFAARGLPLYLKVAAGEARRWRSFDAIAPLPTTTAALLEAVLARLESPQQHGRALVGHSLGDLAVARFGLAEDELLDLLARDDAVRADLSRIAPASPPVEPDLPLPAALWARLAAELETLLTEHEGGEARLLTFYHRELREAVIHRYGGAEASRERRRALAQYFASQPWQLGAALWNERKVDELVFQQDRAGDWAEADQTLSLLVPILERAQREQADHQGVDAVTDALSRAVYVGEHAQPEMRLYALQLAAKRALGDRGGEQEILDQLGFVANATGQHALAQDYFEQALVIARAMGDRAGEAQTLNDLGSQEMYTGEMEASRLHLNQALAIWRELGYRGSEGDTLNELGVLEKLLGHMERARESYLQALAIAREEGHRAGEGTLLSNLGDVNIDLGHFDEALRNCEQALTIAREIHSRRIEANVLNNLGALANQRGQPERARQYYEQALAIHRELGDRGGEGTLSNLGNLALEAGRTDEALDYLNQALTAARAAGNRVREGMIVAELGATYDKTGKPDAAKECFKQALAIAHETGNRAGAASILFQLGRLADSATFAYFDAFHVGSMIHDRKRFSENLERVLDAQDYFKQALAIQQALGDRKGAGITLDHMGICFHRLGQRRRARRYYRQALALFVAIGDTGWADTVRGNLAALTAKRKRRTWWPFRRRR